MLPPSSLARLPSGRSTHPPRTTAPICYCSFRGPIDSVRREVSRSRHRRKVLPMKKATAKKTAPMATARKAAPAKKPAATKARGKR